MTTPAQLSNCCKAPITMAHGCDADFGHGDKKCDCEIVSAWNACTQCQKPCDVYIYKDDNIKNILINISDELLNEIERIRSQINILDKESFDRMNFQTHGMLFAVKLIINKVKKLYENKDNL